MEKRRYTVRFSFTAEFEAENDAHALRDAAERLETGIHEMKHLSLEVRAAVPLATANVPPAPRLADIPTAEK